MQPQLEDSVNRILVVGAVDLLVGVDPMIRARKDIARTNVATAEEAPAVARQIRPSLLIVDGAPPSADTLIGRLRDDPATRALSIVAVLPFFSEERELALREAGADVILAGPLDLFVWDARVEPLLKAPRRRALRVPVDLRSWSQGSPAEPSRQGVALNMGVHGMLLESTSPLEVGTKLDLSFSLPESQRELKVVGQVVRKAGQGEGRSLSGVEFVVLRGDARDRISRFVESTTDAPRLAETSPAAGARFMTERTSWEAELRASEARKAAILDSVFDCIITIDHEGRIIEFNRAAERTFGHSRVEVLGRRAVDVIVPPAQRSPQGDAFAPLFATEASLGERRETTGVRKDGSEFPMELAVTPVPLAQRRLYTVCLHDITERKQIEAEFRQAQKMEAVGRLAGGVAHDFNNLLNVIGGYAELLLRQLPADGPLHKKAGEIARAAEKAAALTRQLLAFSRKQVLQPRVVDMNVIVGDVERMLARLIGENIELRTDLDAALGRLRADPGQMEQVLTNLVVNARDALPKGGRITITTRNVALDERFTREHPGSRPGPHVMLQVSDTGVGMDAETLRHVFEPFFSTKAKGKGTGLGLAMVYGIVKQSQGYIWVDSQPGRGATFQIYLPRVDEPAEAAQPAVHGAGATGSETILLVEDEDVLRMMASEVLEASGYTVLEASGGEEAVRVSESHAGPIHLLVTDVIMPGISGPEVAQRLAASRPGMKVLYASGYTDDAIAQHGVLDAATAFLQKPYNASALETKVREILDSA